LVTWIWQIVLFAVDETFDPGNLAYKVRPQLPPELSSGALMQERGARHPSSIAALGFASLGVVFGDIGTSPLYTLKTVLDLTGGGGARGAVPDRVDAHRDYQHQIRYHCHADRQ
jgi:hypothetical protein